MQSDPHIASRAHGTEPAETLHPRDLAVIRGQIGREPRALASVAARCVYGYPAATRQAPADQRGARFPTACYLTCPHLVRQIDRLEAEGGVKRWERASAADPQLRDALVAAQRLHQQVHDGNRIAGSGSDEHLKCLHAHAAFALAGFEHPLGRSVLGEAAPHWCSGAVCARFGD